MGNRNRPTPKFRREALRLALTGGRTRREIAEDPGIGLSTLTRWLREECDVREPSEAPVDVHTELRRLRRENAVLKHLSRTRKRFSGSLSRRMAVNRRAKLPPYRRAILPPRWAWRSGPEPTELITEWRRIRR